MDLANGLLAIPAPSDARLATLIRKLRLLALREVLSVRAASLGGPVRRALPQVQALLTRAARAHPGPTLDAIGSDDVLAPVLAMASGASPPEVALRAAVPALLARLAHRRGAIEESVLWDVPIDVLARPAQGVVHRFDPPALGLLADPSGTELRLADGSRTPLAALGGERAFVAIPGARAQLALHDANLLAMLEEHPDKQGNAVDLGGRAPEAWAQALGDAIDVVRAALPTVHDELELTMTRIVPVGFEPERHLSASYREAPGLVYLTLHPSVLTLAEAIVHETQHGKLNVLSWFDPVLVNGRTEWTPSPVRPDLRPLAGVLLAVHAFVPVAAMHARLAELGHPLAATPEFARRRAQVLAGNERGLAIVRERGEPTALGREILAALEALHAATVALAPPAPPPAPDALPPG